MIRVGLFGAGGRMGQEITNLLQASKTLTLHYPVQRSTEWNEAKAGEVDVWIDFSLAESFGDVLEKVGSAGKPLVSGTTGLSKEQFEAIASLGKEQPVLWASNMSLGVAVLTEALKTFEALKNFDFQIEETHHIRKKDKPSGTALSLQKALSEVVKKDLPEVLAIRGGGVYGEHKVFALGEDEVLSFTHSALNRTVFARGAVEAATWIVKQGPGLYQISDMLFRK